MPVVAPSIDELRRIGDSFDLALSESDLEGFRELILAMLPTYAELERLPELELPVRYPRSPGRTPRRAENPLNAWSWHCSIRGAREGVLSGRTVAIKDNIAVAGVPMMNGSSLLQRYVPDVDATVVTRILDMGGEITGKAACEDLSFSGGSHTCKTGPIRNPWNPTRSAGGSSSGSAALVATYEVDMALGGDQGGSIRIPSSWCGTVGLKPTRGLVPYTGAFPVEMTLDHLGPMARSVTDVAILLEAIAGTDGLDPRQPESVETHAYSSLARLGGRGLRVAVVAEGFGWPNRSEAEVDEAVREATRLFERAGLTVSDTSIPLHRSALHVWGAIATEGAAQLMVKGNGFGTNHEGFFMTSLIDAFGRGKRSHAHDLPATVKLTLLLGEYLQHRYHGRYYAKAQNIVPALRRAYDDALEEADLLVMPTLPMRATELPPADMTLEQCVTRAQEMVVNTAAFDATDHPAITVPCAKIDGLPVGMMIVGRRWNDALVLRAAYAFEQELGGFDQLLGRPETAVGATDSDTSRAPRAVREDAARPIGSQG